MAKLPVQTTPVLNEDGTMSNEWYRALTNIVDGAGSDSIKSIVSGVASAQAQVNRIVAGTEPMAGVLLSDRGQIIEVVDLNSEAINGLAGAGASLAVSASPTSRSGSRAGAGGVTTGSITFAALNGTGPFTGVFSKVSGTQVFTEFTSTFTGATLATTFSTTISALDIVNSRYKLTITDTSDASTAEVQFSLSAYDTNVTS
jgi:hypothetical protein